MGKNTLSKTHTSNEMFTQMFRGYSKELKKWLYGFLFDGTPNYCFKEDYERLGRNLYILKPGFADWGMPPSIEQYPVEENSVGMYTGVTVKFDGKDVPIYTGMRIDVCDENGRRENLVVSGPCGGYFVCGGDDYPNTPLGELLEIHKVVDPEGF